MNYERIARELRAIPNRKTADIDRYNKQLIKAGADVTDLKNHALSDQLVHRTYFQVSLAYCKTTEAQFQFIEENEDLLRDWWHVDQLTQFIKKPVDFSFAYEKAREYVVSPKPFTRRWGYVLFLTGLQKDATHTEDILRLMHDDDEYYVQMAQGWLICDLAVFNPEAVYDFMKESTLHYNILGKAIQKISDSFRFTQEQKERFRALRERWR